MAAIDYGVMAFRNGKQIYGDDLYPNIQIGNLTIQCYKLFCSFDHNSGAAISFYGCDPSGKYKYTFGKVSVRFEVGGIAFHIKQITRCVYRLTFVYDGDYYTILYGYGIDNDIGTWHRVKKVYLGKRNARIVDKEIRRALNG